MAVPACHWMAVRRWASIYTSAVWIPISHRYPRCLAEVGGVSGEHWKVWRGREVRWSVACSGGGVDFGKRRCRFDSQGIGALLASPFIIDPEAPSADLYVLY
jgi:hypothetical protein